MPITPFHLGPGAAVKAALRGHFSFAVFAFSQFLIDLEPVLWFAATGDPLHPHLHTYLGATLVFLASWTAGRPVCAWAIRLWNSRLSPAQARWLECEPAISSRAALVGAFIGAYSHVAIDSVMHGDMRPFAPFSDASPWHQALSLETLHIACVLAGLLGVALLLIYRWRELKARR